MSCFDINIHLPCLSTSLADMLVEDVSLSGHGLEDCFVQHFPAIRRQADGANFMLFNQSLGVAEVAEFIARVRQEMPRARFTLLAKIDSQRAHARLVAMKEAGIDAIKFHSYVQKISKYEFPAAVAVANKAADLGMPIFVDASYGSTVMYRYDNLRLVAAILDQVSSVPVVILHSGGARAIEAMLLAESSTNVFLDMSFSVQYYLGSRIEQDLAFAYKRIGPERVVYGSDFPYVSFEQSSQTAAAFFERNGFSDSDRAIMLSESAQKVFV